MGKIKILIVEDEKLQRTILERLIPKKDFDIEFAMNGNDALQIMDKSLPEIVFSDVNMPGMGGGELITKARSNPAFETAYFIMYSGDCSVESSSRLLNLGANDFISKPVRREELIARLGVAVRHVEQLRTSKTGFREMYGNMDVLLIQDGGCAPGYNPVTAFLTKYIEAKGRDVYCAREGFRSIVSGLDGDFSRLTYNYLLYRKIEHIQGVVHVPHLIEAAGARFRSERYKEFKDMEIVARGCENIVERGVKAVVAIGGNGTLYGVKDMAKVLPDNVQLFFIPVTVDSDVYGTETIGQHTGVEFGAEKVRAYMSDARTHKRVYLLEMMGAKGGFHALHSCLGAHAHLAALPGFEYDMEKVAHGINARESVVVVVAEGYKKELSPDFPGNAAEFFHDQLKKTGVKINKNVICEPFSRDIRGVPPNNVDSILAMRMAWNVAEYLAEGESKLMPAILGENHVPTHFEDITTDNTVNKKMAALSNRLY